MIKKEILETISRVYKEVEILRDTATEDSEEYDDEMLGDLQVVFNKLSDVVVMVKMLRKKL